MPLRIAPPGQQADIDSHYYIHHSEGPNPICISPKLNGSNYLAWNKSMMRALGAKNKLQFVDGTIDIPPHRNQ